MKDNNFPAGWDEARVKRVLDHYENQTEDEAAVEDEAAFESAAADETLMQVPTELVPVVRDLIARHNAHAA